MRVIVTGGRNFDANEVLRGLDEAECLRGPFKTIVHGGSGNTDHAASRWALMHGAALQVFDADWRGQGRAAGPLRNQKMVEAGADLCVAFPGGTGTADCVKRAVEAGIDVMWPCGVGVAQLTPEQRDEYQERAAIMEFHGGLPREEAEAEALKLVTRKERGND